MKKKLLLVCSCLFVLQAGMLAQELKIDSTTLCEVALDTIDEFDTTRMIATLPIKIGFLVPTKNLSEDLQGETVTDEAKVVFSYAESANRIRSFFLTLVVVEHQYLNISNDMNVLLKLTNGQIIKLYNVPDKAELNRDIIMWMYQHTCVVPLETYHILKNEKVDKIRINYDNYKRTIVLEPDQQQALQDAVTCVEERLRRTAVKP